MMKVKKYEQTYNRIMNELLDIWVDNDKELQKLDSCLEGIRNKQVGALVILLIKKGILK